MAVSSTHRGWLYKQNEGLLAAVLNGAKSGASVLATNTALEGVLLGTPVTPALAVDSLVFSNLVASGDILIAANNGGNSQAWLWVDSSAGTMRLYGAGTAVLETAATYAQVLDDILLGIGTGNTARFSWDTTDANSNQLLLQLPAAGSVDSPVLIIGQSIESIDFGAAAAGADYSGVVDPRIAIFSSGAVTTGPVIEFRKARGTTAAPTVCTTGDDVGTLDFYGAVANGEYVRSASIRADIAGTIATTRGPGTLTFLTATDAAPSVLTAALTLNANQSATFAGDVTLPSGFGLNVGSTTQATISNGDGATNLIPEVQALGVGTAFAGGALLLGTFNATNDRTVSPKLAFLKGAAATQVATTAVANDEVVGSIIAYGSDSADFETPVAAIEFVVDDSGGPAAGQIGGSIEFYTTADGGETLTKALTLGTDQSATFTGVIVLPSAASINGTGSITVNNDSADVDFIVESNGNANMFTVDAALDAIGIGGTAVTSQTLTVTNATLNATAGRILKLSGSVAAPNFGDGYGALETDITFSGTVAGTSAASSTWVNIAASAVPGANIISPRNDGIWVASGVTATNAIMVLGGRLQYVPNDGADCSNIHLFDTNIYDNVLKSLFRVNAIGDMGGSTGAASGNDYKIPLFYDVTANQVWSVNVYHA